MESRTGPNPWDNLIAQLAQLSQAVQKLHDKHVGDPEPIWQEGHILPLLSELLAQIKKACTGTDLSEHPDSTLSDGFLLHKGKIFVPESLQEVVLNFTHNNLLAGHFGIIKTQELTKRYFWWILRRKM